MWVRTKRALRSLDAVRVENRVELGTPDVNTICCWVELKWLRKKPKEGAVLHIEHYTEDQKTWSIRRHNAGGKVFLLLKVGPEWLIFWGVVAAEYLNQVPLEELRKVAIKTWKKLNDQELREILSLPFPQGKLF